MQNSGLCRVKKSSAKARNRIPTPVISQAMSKAWPFATAAMFCGKLNTPEPTIELNTKAVKESKPILAVDIRKSYCLKN